MNRENHSTNIEFYGKGVHCWGKKEKKGKKKKENATNFPTNSYSDYPFVLM